MPKVTLAAKGPHNGLVFVKDPATGEHVKIRASSGEVHVSAQLAAIIADYPDVTVIDDEKPKAAAPKVETEKEEKPEKATKAPRTKPARKWGKK